MEYDRIRNLAATLDPLDHRTERTYDAGSRRLTVTDPKGSVTRFSYDPLDRLVATTDPLGGITRFTYDANDNLRTVTDAKTQTTHPSDPMNHLETRTDALNRIERFTYDGFGNLTAVALPNGTTIDYLLDGPHRRIGKKVNGTLVQGFLYSGRLRPAAELDGAGQIVSRFVYATKSNVPEYFVKSGVTYRIVTDHLGSVRLVVDVATGTIAQRLDYDEFGQITQDTNPGFQPFGFAGGLYDPDTKLTRFGARDL